MTVTNSCKSVRSRDKWHRSSFKKLQSIIKNYDVSVKLKERETHEMNNC